ncbi:MAG: DUF952 domain-containing protein [Granulosicoccus sp.]|nr:DUF952 domain-containing protein [Granulosicoccus sp.]
MIYHIANSEDLERGRATGEYCCASLATEGFIHCCTAEQLSGVVERYYQGAPELQLLTLDPSALVDPPVWENTSGTEELFPHVYQAIPLQAIVDATSFEPDQLECLQMAHPYLSRSDAG